jgi:hypothetical protein
VHKEWGFYKQNVGITVSYVKVNASDVMKYIDEKNITIRYKHSTRDGEDATNLCYAVKLSKDDNLIKITNAYVELIYFGINEHSINLLSNYYRVNGIKCPCSSTGKQIHPLGYISHWKKNCKENMKQLANDEQWKWLI